MKKKIIHPCSSHMILFDAYNEILVKYHLHIYYCLLKDLN
jgi:hypothetical protein